MSGELTSRHWLGDCPSGPSMSIKLTEVEPGQFAETAHADWQIPCWSRCPTPTQHTLYPCTEAQYGADDEPEGDL